MQLQRVLIVLTVVNLTLAAFNLLTSGTSVAAAPDDILRGRGLQIIDAQGRVRAGITLIPADSAARYPDGRVGSPETVLLRLVDEHGKPNVKLGASEEGGFLGLGGGRDPAYARLGPEHGLPTLTLKNARGQQRRIAASLK